MREPKNPKSCRERALGLLAVRARGRHELEVRLLRAGFPADEVTDVVERLAAVGLVDDLAFARQVVEHELGARRSGTRAVSSALAAKGIAPAVIEQVLGEVGGDEDARAEELARARATRMRGLEPATAFTRLSSLLVRRGYAPDVARRAARGALAASLAEADAALASDLPGP